MSEKKKVISTPIQLKMEIEKLCGDACDAVFIFNLLESSSYSISESVVLNKTELRDKVTQLCNEYKPYHRIQRVVQNTLIMPLNKRNWFIWDEGNYRTHATKKETVVTDFNRKQDYLRNSEQVQSVYLPKRKYGLTIYNGDLVFNSYKAPSWLEDYYRHNMPLPLVQEVPPLYEKFLKHLVNNDVESYDYVLDWMAISLQSRNLAFLTTIGRAGIGKGFLARIIDALHGVDHSVMVEFSTIQSNFNSATAEKTFVYYNEANRMSEKDKVRMKMQNEEKVRNEQKGVDAEVVNNYSNIYISSNNMDAMQLDSDDRRFSIINLTETRLENVLTQDEIHALAPKEGVVFEHLNQFGYYLMQRKYKEEHTRDSFKSEQTKRIKDAAAYDWEKWIIDDFCKDHAGKTITVRAVSEYASTVFKKVVISEKNLKSLSEKFKGVFKVLKTDEYMETAMIGSKPGFKPSENENNKRLSCMKINKLNEQTNHEVREVEND